MTASDFYNERTILENFGRSKAFESCRRMREVMPGFPQFSEIVNEFHSGWLIYLMAKTGNTSTRKAFEKAILAGKDLKCGNELFSIWLGNLLLNPEHIKNKLKSIWIFEDENLVHVNWGDHIQIFQGPHTPKQVSRATVLSPQFFYDFAVTLDKTLVDESLGSEIILSDDSIDEDDD